MPVFSQSVAFFILLTRYLLVQKLFILVKSNLSVFSLWIVLLVSSLRTCHQALDPEGFLRYLYKIWDFGWVSFFGLWMSSRSSTICRRLSSFHWAHLAPLSKSNWLYLRGPASEFSISFHLCMHLSFQYHHLDYCGCKISLKMGSDPSCFIFLVKNCLSSSSFTFPDTF